MNKIIIDFAKFSNEKELYIYIYKELLRTIPDMKNVINIELMNKYWGWPDGFRDYFWYRDDKDFFILKNFNFIKDKYFKERMVVFISVLERFKWYESVDWWSVPNPNFDYLIES